MNGCHLVGSRGQYFNIFPGLDCFLRFFNCSTSPYHHWSFNTSPSLWVLVIANLLMFSCLYRTCTSHFHLQLIISQNTYIHTFWYVLLQSSMLVITSYHLRHTVNLSQRFTKIWILHIKHVWFSKVPDHKKLDFCVTGIGPWNSSTHYLKAWRFSEILRKISLSVKPVWLFYIFRFSLYFRWSWFLVPIWSFLTLILRPIKATFDFFKAMN